MRTRQIAAGVILGAFVAVTAQALDRDARMIGSANAGLTSYRAMKLAGLSIWDESAFFYGRSWGLVAGGGLGQFLDGMYDGENVWFGALGVKWYPQDTTSLSLIGKYQQADSGVPFRMAGGTVALEQRFITRAASVSPFFTTSASLEDTKVVEGDGFTCLVVKAGLGCDFTVRDDLVLAFQWEMMQSQDFADRPEGNYARGWVGSVGMRYYWF